MARVWNLSCLKRLLAALLAAYMLLIPHALAVQTESQAQIEQLLTERIRSQSLQSALGRLWVLEPVALANAGFIVEGEDDVQVFGEGDFIYVQGGVVDRGGRYHIFRRRSTYQDPTSSELLGLEVELIGTAEQVSVASGQQVLKITSADELILVGHQLIPASWRTKLDERMVPTKADTSLRGQIISSVGLSSNLNGNIGVEAVVAINLGVREGLNKGNLVSVLNPDTADRLGVRPDTPVGTGKRQVGMIYVVQTFIKMSYGVILQADTEIKAGDRLCTAAACDGKI